MSVITNGEWEASVRNSFAILMLDLLIDVEVFFTTKLEVIL